MTYLLLTSLVKISKTYHIDRVREILGRVYRYLKKEGETIFNT